MESCVSLGKVLNLSGLLSEERAKGKLCSGFFQGSWPCAALRLQWGSADLQTRTKSLYPRGRHSSHQRHHLPGLWVWGCEVYLLDNRVCPTNYQLNLDLMTSQFLYLDNEHSNNGSHQHRMSEKLRGTSACSAPCLEHAWHSLNEKQLVLFSLGRSDLYPWP